MFLKFLKSAVRWVNLLRQKGAFSQSGLAEGHATKEATQQI
jgi:hypothetical protein